MVVSSSASRMVLLLCLLPLISCGDTGPSATQPWVVDTGFVEDPTPTSNPERGMYRTFSMFTPGPELDNAQADLATSNGLVKGSSLVLFKYLMNNGGIVGLPPMGMAYDYCDDATIDADHLDIVDTVCAALRSRQMKCVFRIFYSTVDGAPNVCGTTDPGPLGTDAANLARVSGHLDQLAPKFAANRDVIAFFEAGIFGAWGEWNDANLPMGQEGMFHDPANRRALISKLLDVIPPDRTLVVRRPRFRRELEIGPMPFPADRMARIGFHNDCFLSNPSDQGTYDEAPLPAPPLVPGLPAFDGGLSLEDNWRRYIRDVVAAFNVPMGGENCPPFGGDPFDPLVLEANGHISDCDVTPGALAHLRFTYLNNEWYYTVPPDNTGTINKWGTAPDACLTEIFTHLGYRFVVRRVAFNDMVSPGGQLEVEVDIENEGYAPLVNDRPLFVVLRGPATYTAQLGLGPKTDPKTWGAGTTSTVNFKLRIPADAPVGTYSVRLHLPDAYSLAANPGWPNAAAMSDDEYCVQFSNVATWDDTTGENVLVDTEVAAGTPGPVDPAATTFAELP